MMQSRYVRMFAFSSEPDKLTALSLFPTEQMKLNNRHFIFTYIVMDIVSASKCVSINLKLRGLSPRATYIDRATIVCRRR
jgi:hypothetical protein